MLEFETELMKNKTKQAGLVCVVLRCVSLFSLIFRLYKQISKTLTEKYMS